MHWDEGLPNALGRGAAQCTGMRGCPMHRTADLEGSTDPCTKNDEGTPNALGSELSGQY